jgi:hypothetical protein
MAMEKPSFASLSSGLLARKGQARPAMRSQGFAGYGSLAGAMDDLGWNDMGHEDHAPEPSPAPVVPVTPDLTHAASPLVPPVLRQRAALRQEVEVPAPKAEDVTEFVAEPVPATPAVIEAPAVPAAAPTLAPTHPHPVQTIVPRKTKAAFTLRLDPARHLRLRLATAITGRSAQALVTEALDAFIAGRPELEGLAGQLPDEEEK